MSQQFDDALARLKAAAETKTQAAVDAAVARTKADFASAAVVASDAAAKAADDENTAKLNALADELTPAETVTEVAGIDTLSGGAGADSFQA